MNFSWGTNSPDPTFLLGAFSVRWTGKVRANQAGTYTFFTLSDDAVRLFVNGQLLISNWTAHPLTENSNNITLAAGQSYDLVMEYFNASAAGTAILAWRPPGGAKQVISNGSLTQHQNNTPPSLGAVTNIVGARGSTLSAMAVASDFDIPAQALSFSLDAGAPVGASIHPVNGTLTWTIPNDQPFGTVQFVVRVTDNGLPQMTDAQIVTITVLANPTLSFGRSSGSAIISWPESGALQLYSTTNLVLPTLWSPVTNETFVSNGTRTLFFSGYSNETRFFRLGPPN